MVDANYSPFTRLETFLSGMETWVKYKKEKDLAPP